jgi:hypothetical protein
MKVAVFWVVAIIALVIESAGSPATLVTFC